LRNLDIIRPHSLVAAFLAVACVAPSLRAADDGELDRSPVALALSTDGTRLLTANQTSGTVSLIDIAAGKVVAEVKTGDRPAGVAFSKDGTRAVVTHWYGYDLALLDVAPTTLKVVGRIEVGPEPRGVVIAADGKTAYVAVGVAGEVVRVDLDAFKITGRLAVGREPRSLALTLDGKRLLVANARSRDVSILTTDPWKVERVVDVDGDNLRQLAVSADGKFAYLANMKNRGFATTKNNIDKGWVLGQRLTRVTIEGDDPSPFATIALDTQGKAAADAHGAAASPDGKFVALSLGGTHEVMLFRLDQRPLPWRLNGSRDLIPPEFMRADDVRFRRVPTGGRPTELAFSPDGKALYVANYFANSVQVLDPETAKVVRAIPLGGVSAPTLARRGEMVFHDATKSFNQWYSCATCHSDGHTNGLDFDTLNDGRQDLSLTHLRSRKKVPTLRRVVLTSPWTWHGWQTDLEHATFESFTKSMQGPRPSNEDVKAVTAYLATLDFPRNPYREKDGSLSAAAKRGEAVFKSSKIGCDNCHASPEFTDGKIHVAGLEEPDDAYQGYNPPSLRGVYDKDPYLHDGRAKTLREALKGPHSPEALSGGLGELSDTDLDDLIAYLKSL
jgi:YVTN family beta-propeller protein